MSEMWMHPYDTGPGYLRYLVLLCIMAILTLGWPEKTEDLDYFYPNDVLVTGYDIIFFWVIRMIFSGYEQMGKAPFHTVLFHGLVRDSQGT